MPIISISKLSKTYTSGFTALRDIDLAIERGEKARAGVAGSGVTVSEVDPAPFKTAVSGVCAELNFEEEAKIVKRAPGQ